MPFPAFTVTYSTAQSPVTYITSPANATIAALVGETLTINPETTLGTFAASVKSAPAGSTAAFPLTGQLPWNYIVPDKPGTYVFSFATGSNTPVTLTVIAFPSAALTAPMLADAAAQRRAAAGPFGAVAAEPRTVPQVRALLGWIATGGGSDAGAGYTPAQFAALTSGQPLPASINMLAAPTV